METIFAQQGTWARAAYKLEGTHCLDQKRFLFRATWKQPLGRPGKAGFTVEYRKIHEVIRELVSQCCTAKQTANNGCPYWAASYVIDFILPQSLALSENKLAIERKKTTNMKVALGQKSEENLRLQKEIKEVAQQFTKIGRTNIPSMKDDAEGRKNLLQWLNTNPLVLCAFFEGTNKVRIIPSDRKAVKNWVDHTLSSFVWWAEFTIH